MSAVTKTRVPIALGGSVDVSRETTCNLGSAETVGWPAT